MQQRSFFFFPQTRSRAQQYFLFPKASHLAKSPDLPQLSMPQSQKSARGCSHHARSVKFLLPFTVAFTVALVAAVTLTLMADNTNRAVNTVVTSLHDQVQLVVVNRVQAHLEQVLTANLASAKDMARRPLPPPPANGTGILPNMTWIVDILDRGVDNNPLVDVHYIFFRNGRVIGVLRNDNVTNLYAEEFYPKGLYFWTYPKGQPSLINQTATPVLIVDSYVGYLRPYFNSMNHKIPLDYAWTNPYLVGPFLLYTNAISINDPTTGEFLGVMGADTYITTLSQFLKDLRPTATTKVFLVDPTESLIVATHGDVIVPETGARIPVTNSSDATIAAAGRVIGNWTSISGTIRTSFVLSGETFLLQVRAFRVLRVDLAIAVVTPELEFLRTVRQQTQVTIGICVAIAVVGVAIIIGLCIAIARSLAQLQGNLDSIARLEFNEQSDGGESDVEGDGGANGDNPVFSELQETQHSYIKLRKALAGFKHYVPISVVHGLIGGSIEPRLGMRPCELAVTFQDVVGFTSLCERFPTDIVVAKVSHTFEIMSNIILGNHGTIDKYIGDAIMAFWLCGTPAIPDGGTACGLALRAAMRSPESWQDADDGLTLSLRTGLHFGAALVGNFGSQQRFNFTVVGDTVNTAARLEPLNKELCTRTLCSEAVVAGLPPGDSAHNNMRYMGHVLLVGKATPMGVYELMHAPTAAQLALLPTWKNAIEAYEAGRFRESNATLAHYTATESGDDPPANQLAAELASLIDDPPARWLGVRHQRAK